MSTPTAIGFDMGATSTKTGVVQNGKILTRGNVIETRQDGDTGALIDAFIQEIRAFERNRHPEVEAVGFGVPGIINPVQGVVVNLTNVKGWSDIPLRSIIMERTGLVGNLENDAKAMAYAEWKHGAGQSVPNVVCVTLGTAVGGALILNGRLYRGATWVAGEIGQTSIDYQGVDFVYGTIKGLWRLMSDTAKSRRGPRRFMRRPGKVYPTKMRIWIGCQKRPTTEMNLPTKSGQDIGLKIGVGLTNVIWLVNPDRIVIGGGVAKAGERLFGYIRQTIRTRCEKTFWEKLEVVPATLGNDAGIIGAAASPSNRSSGRGEG